MTRIINAAILAWILGMPLAGGAAVSDAKAAAAKLKESIDELFKRADEALDEDDLGRDISIYEDILQQDPDNYAAGYRLGTIYLKKGEKNRESRDKGIKILHGLMKDNPNYAHPYFTFIAYCLNKGFPAPAKSWAEKFKRNNPESKMGNVMVGAVYMAEKDIRNAETEYSKSGRLGHLFLGAHYLGLGDKKEKDYAKAKQAFLRARERELEEPDIIFCLHFKVGPNSSIPSNNMSSAIVAETYLLHIGLNSQFFSTMWSDTDLYRHWVG